jgi:hypothetical protein
LVARAALGEDIEEHAEFRIKTVFVDNGVFHYFVARQFLLLG